MVELGLSPEGKMEAPNSPDAVGWYGIAAKPGEGGNVILSGHVDWKTSTAVFWHLKHLDVGEAIHIRSEDGSEHDYTVQDSTVYETENAPLEEIVGPTPTEMLTIITCEGVFRDGDYSHRRVVRAQHS